MNQIKSITIILLGVLFSCSEKPENEISVNLNSNSYQKEALLIGTFHYNNPGADVVKTKSFDILSESSQIELEEIALKIKDYNPTKIFVEWPYDEQSELDSLYNLYKEDRYYLIDNLSDFYLKNEIFQLAFRVGKANKIEKIYGMDYTQTSFPFGEVMGDIEKNKQHKLKEKIENGISKMTIDFDNKIESGASLKELTYYLNSPEMRVFSNKFHNDLMLLAGNANDFSGSLLTSEWYKRNLYMWSLIQKNTLDADDRVMVLTGSSHAAMFELFINTNENWQVKELKGIMAENI